MAVVAACLLGLLAFQLLGGLLAGIFARTLLQSVLISVSTYAIGLIVIALVASSGSEQRSKSWRIPALRLRSWAVAIVALLALGEALSALIALSGLGAHGTLGMLNTLMARVEPAELALSVLVLALLGGSAEELFFRGVLQQKLVGALGRWEGIAATSVLFGLIHFDLVQSPAAMLMGLYFGWLADRTGSIAPGIAAHVVNNAVAVLLPAIAPMPWPDAVHLAELLIAPPIAAAAIWWLHQTLPPRQLDEATPPPATDSR